MVNVNAAAGARVSDGGLDSSRIAPLGSSVRGVNRRKHARVKVSLPVLLRTDLHSVFEGDTVDLSSHGALIRLDRLVDLPVGGMVTVALSFTRGRNPVLRSELESGEHSSVVRTGVVQRVSLEQEEDLEASIDGHPSNWLVVAIGWEVAVDISNLLPGA